MTYTDARLHLEVRPPLEHLIPRAGEAVRAALLGDTSLEEARLVLEAVDVDAPKATGEVPDEYAAIVERVARLLKAHLTRAVAAWDAHLRDVQREVQLLAAEIRLQQRRGGATNLARQLDVGLARIRERPLPGCRRDAELAAACAELKAQCAASYGSRPTRELVALKASVEAQLLVQAQGSVGSYFVRQMQKVLACGKHAP